MDAYPLPRIDTCLDCLSTARFFSTADLQSGYWQLKLDEKDRAKTAFITRYGLYEYTKLPMGLSSAPSTFQRWMELIFRGLQWKKLLIYLDDIIIYCPDIESHLSDLSEVLDLLQKAGLKLKPAKCHLLQSEVLFLGHIVSVNGLLSNPALLENVKNWNPPKDVKQIQQFIGLCNYYRRFIYGFSDLASPITELTKKDVPFRWSEECQNAFDLLKQALCSAPILAYPKNEGTYILDTDASDSGVSGVLSQVQEGCERVICYGSKKLSKTQRNYCVIRRELLAAITFITEYRHYLLGHSFILRTDHGSLRWLFGFKEPQGQLARWLEVLSQYQFKIEPRAGRLHTNADALSRKWCGIKECDCYERDIKPEMLPCRGCKKCLRMHEDWQRFQEEVDEIIPLASTHASPGKNIQGATQGLTCSHVTTLSSIPVPHEGAPGLDNDNETRTQRPSNWIGSYTTAELSEMQRADPALLPLHEWFDAGQRPEREEAASFSAATRKYWLNWENITRIGGILYQKWLHRDGIGHTKLQLLVPKVLRQEVLNQCHNSIYSGHQGIHKTTLRIKQSYHWYRMREDVKLHITRCLYVTRCLFC